MAQIYRTGAEETCEAHVASIAAASMAHATSDPETNLLTHMRLLACLSTAHTGTQQNYDAGTPFATREAVLAVSAASAQLHAGVIDALVGSQRAAAGGTTNVEEDEMAIAERLQKVMWGQDAVPWTTLDARTALARRTKAAPPRAPAPASQSAARQPPQHAPAPPPSHNAPPPAAAQLRQPPPPAPAESSRSALFRAPSNAGFSAPAAAPQAQNWKRRRTEAGFGENGKGRAADEPARRGGRGDDAWTRRGRNDRREPEREGEPTRFGTAGSAARLGLKPRDLRSAERDDDGDDESGAPSWAGAFRSAAGGQAKRGFQAPQTVNREGGDGDGSAGGSKLGKPPPYVRKAIGANGANGGGNAGGGAKDAAKEEDGGLPPKVAELLADPETGELPENLAGIGPELLDTVCRECLLPAGTKQVSWDAIAGLADVKSRVFETVVWPIHHPSLFTGPRAPPKGLLLFGPPGTGKTMIGRAVASEIAASFFNVSAANLCSKWIGEGEKMVRALFAVARHLAPSVVFVDEVDSVLGARSSGEHESSRRLKTQLLIEMEGIGDGTTPGAKPRPMLVIGATNRPEELDEAARRRLPKQLYIPLPCAEARKAIVDIFLRNEFDEDAASSGDAKAPLGDKVRARLSPSELSTLLSKTEGYSGSDMRALIQEASYGPVRELQRAAMVDGGQLPAAGSLTADQLRPVVLEDFRRAARQQRRSVSEEEVKRYEEYNSRFGASRADADADGVAGSQWGDDDGW